MCKEWKGSQCLLILKRKGNRCAVFSYSYCNSPLTRGNKSWMQKFALYSQQNWKMIQITHRWRSGRVLTAKKNPKKLFKTSFHSVTVWLPFPASFSSDYVFVTPVEVDPEGGFLTHDVTRRTHRSRRSLSSSLHYRLSAFGHDMHLDLHPSSVVGPGFTVQALGSDGITTLTEDVGFHDCLYQGFIRNLSASSAAISTCAGLVSVCF